MDFGGEAEQATGAERAKRIGKRALGTLAVAAFIWGAAYLAGDAERRDLDNRQEFHDRYYGEDNVFDGKQFNQDILDTIADKQGLNPESVRLVNAWEFKQAANSDD